MDIKKSLGTKVGPLPMAAWAGIVLIAVIVISAYRKSSTKTDTTTEAQLKEFESTATMNDWTTVAQVPQPIIVQIPSPNTPAPSVNVTVGSNAASSPVSSPTRDPVVQLQNNAQANADAAYRAYQNALSAAQALHSDPTATNQSEAQRNALAALSAAAAASNSANDAVKATW